MSDVTLCRYSFTVNTARNSIFPIAAILTELSSSPNTTLLAAATQEVRLSADSGG